jgi:dihydrofolate reductase
MRKIITTTFVTLDGVIQAPGGPEEDPTNKFKWGGWSANYWDDMMGNVMGESMKKDFDLLLGRKTYEIFAAHWPYIKNDPVADQFNSTKKYVVSHQPMDLAWKNSTLISENVVEELKKLKKQDGNDMWVHGSVNLIQTLLSNHLVDAMHLWIFPVTIGKGKRLFAEGTNPGNLKLTSSKTSTTGVVITSYEPAGELITGSFALDTPTDAELARRKRMKEEE